jgi:hypothetical protein
VVLIEADTPVHAPLPVLSRGLAVQPGLEPPLPTVEAVAPAGGQPVARLGETIDLAGHHLDGTGRSALLMNDRFEIEQSITAMGTGGAALLRFVIPIAQAADFPVGVYRVGARVQRTGEPAPRDSNRLAMTLAPELTGLPLNVALDGGTASFTINFRPALRAGQSVTLVLGQQEFAPQPFTPPASSLDFVIENAPVSPPPPAGQAPGHLARLRIDGIDSPVIDRAATPPVFLNQRIVIA